jgi:hypothetical protein
MKTGRSKSYYAREGSRVTLETLERQLKRRTKR